MNNLFKIITLIGILTLFLNCWNKQKHEVTRPIVPHYIFNGTAVEYDTGESLSNIVIELKATKMLYDVVFETQYDTTDSSGNFSFNPVYPGYYNWRVQSYGCWLKEQKMEISHRDSTSIIKIPQLFYAQIFQKSSNPNHPALAINGTKAWYNVYHNAGVPPWIKSDLIRVYKLSNKSWGEEKYFISPFFKRNITSMAFGRDYLYACITPDTLYIVNILDCTLSGKFIMSQNITAVTFNIPQNCIYTCSKNFIYRHEAEHPVNIVQTWNYENSTLSAIAYYKTIYTYDNNQYLLRKYDKDMNISTTYALINSAANTQILDIYDMSFDGYGQLWVIEFNK